MYINFWYPICTTEDLTGDAPLRAELLGVRLVAFRDGEGNAHVMCDTCIHRGASLSKGRTVDGCIECPYHGWRYDGAGKCVSIPTQNGKKPPARAKVDSYPVCERYGIVFAFLGDLGEAERPPLPVVEEDGRDGWDVSGPMVFEIDAYFERSVENGMDPIHNEFVHPAQGAPAVEEDRFSVETGSWGSRFEVAFGAYAQPESRQKVAETDDSGTVGLRAGSWHIGPNTLVTGIHLPGDNSFIQYFFEAPVAMDRTRIYFVNARNNNLGTDKDDWINSTFMNIAGEDRAVIEELWPVGTPDTLTKELLTPGDAAVVQYRDFLKTWDSRGWRIDWPAMKQKEHSVAYAIPSPGRRESGNWILDTIPLVKYPTTHRNRCATSRPCRVLSSQKTIRQSGSAMTAAQGIIFLIDLGKKIS
ncbi:MAG: Rieske 2Fe-2S domain-containing protein [Gammaproteobacteria bacterium]